MASSSSSSSAPSSGLGHSAPVGTVPKDAAEGCPGVEAADAGKSDACAGCPNQAICASGEARAVDPTPDLVAARLSEVKRIILVLSGKGGVGKSTVSSQLAFTLAASGASVGLLDVDITGPSIPRMLGLRGQTVHQSATGWSPVWLDEGLGVMSIGFMLPDEDDAVIWRGPRKNGLIRQFLTDVEWGALDYLIIDTPPGTSDEHISLAQYLKKAPVAGAVVVTTPQQVAMSDVRKELSFCRKTATPVLGVVENMSGFACPCCGTVTQIFAPAEGGGRGMAERAGVPFAGSIPLDPRLMAACESGEAFVEAHSATEAAQSLATVVRHISKAAGGEATLGDELEATLAEGAEALAKAVPHSHGASSAGPAQ
ncbi:hypothetical protein FNF27_04463 [Cafeteria roenbergensis]|uniref:Multifunctional fusion protein n=2 Tax=Cafeteria roenbergensis TaxID=33653 RepID=A0A5A8CCV9_CAFRO|nr:hypothetical protein FNF28_07484 [Cafeteria roenbergensis]KAA0150876.1 hypothetical protein FNF29_04990 [Cafeteria roenbergensis]KAA0154805.1 hypothetical protein FNF31_06224 [Cafeteria roenbergensis]KAA0174077.1 hypothetical protein FNF27_04463 [Cafeteria roenbergensis]|eukprot:KAA0150876.1 hypothetical protein FNF29_04990 [Cafeteria roenbergensis]